MPPRKGPGRVIAARQRAEIEIAGRALRIGARDVPLYSGAMHYWRLERDAWRPALQEIQNLGMSIVETYVPWGVHELTRGHFDFGERDPRNDLGAFLDLVHELKLSAIVRPGPHINAELTRFGLPERVIHDRACQARSPRGNPVILGFPPQMFPVPSYASRAFLEEVGVWYDAMAEVVKPRLFPRGPVVMMQVDNEAAFYFRDGPYCQDYHPDAIAGWHAYLERRYGDVATASRAHRANYATWDSAEPPTNFRARESGDLVRHVDWAAYKEQLITDSLVRMRDRMVEAGIEGVPFLHNAPLGDGGQPIHLPAIGRVMDLVGLDYYHARREHRTIKRRTLYMEGSFEFPYAPELGVGAPPWFTPLAHEDSLYCAMAACAYGLRGFNLYMAVDRDRWYGAPIDARGTPRIEAGAWKHLISSLHVHRFHELERKVEVALIVPREYGRLSRATHLLGPVSPAALETLGGTPVDACREDAFGFGGPIQVLWWRMLARFSDALSAAGVPYAYVDSECDPERLERFRVLITPSYEFASLDRWKRIVAFAARGGAVVFGPAMPSLDEQMRSHLFEVPRDGRCVLIDKPADAEQVVSDLVHSLELERPFRASPAPVETTVHEDEHGARVLFVLNPDRRAVEAQVALPSPSILVDLMSGERLRGDATVQVPMGSLSVRMFAIEHGPEPQIAASRVARARRRAS